MEFPELGTHCSSPICSRLDFLPIECDACHKIFCKDHSPYEQHQCQLSYTKDARVPVCPLCNQPVPVTRGEDPNIKVDLHMQNECKSEKAKNISNRCTVPGCKKKELVPVKCTTCQKNFCLKHRFETDHNCQGHPLRLGGKSQAGNNRGMAPNKSVDRSKKGSRGGAPQKTTLSHIGADLNRERMLRQQERLSSGHTSTSQAPLQPNIGEDEAMALAIAASIGESEPRPSPSTLSQPSPSPMAHHHPSHTQSHNSSTPPPSTAEDEALARAIAASLNDEDQPKPKPKNTTSSNSGTRHRDKNTDSGISCTIS